MRGGFVHNRCLIAPLVETCRELGITVRLEAPVGPGRHAGHVDALIGGGDFRVAVEAECSARRVKRDVIKARTLDVQELWIIVPTRAVARAVGRVVALAEPAPSLTVFVFSEAQARQRLAHCFPLLSAPKVRGTEGKERSGTCG